jgi:hypothetical protein
VTPDDQLKLDLERPPETGTPLGPAPAPLSFVPTALRMEGGWEEPKSTTFARSRRSRLRAFTRSR